MSRAGVWSRSWTSATCFCGSCWSCYLTCVLSSCHFVCLYAVVPPLRIQNLSTSSLIMQSVWCMTLNFLIERQNLKIKTFWWECYLNNMDVVLVSVVPLSVNPDSNLTLTFSITYCNNHRSLQVSQAIQLWFTLCVWLFCSDIFIHKSVFYIVYCVFRFFRLRFVSRLIN